MDTNSTSQTQNESEGQTGCEACIRKDEQVTRMYEACKEMMARFNQGTRFPLQSTCDKMNQAIAGVEK